MKRLEELLQELPPELQQEVYDFARFLLETKAQSSPKGQATPNLGGSVA